MLLYHHPYHPFIPKNAINRPIGANILHKNLKKKDDTLYFRLNQH